MPPHAQGSHLRGPIVLIARVKPHRATVTAREDAVAIELDFVDPAYALGWGVYECGQLG